jgi:hypothetical protein
MNERASRGFLGKITCAAIVIGNVFVFISHILGPLIIVLGLRTEVLTGNSYEYSIGMVFVSFLAVFLLLLFLYANYGSIRWGGFWRWILLSCLLFLMLVRLSEAISGHAEYGMVYVVKREYFSSLFFFVWVFINYLYWFILRKPRSL